MTNQLTPIQQAVVESKEKAGLTSKLPSDWTYNERVSYNQALSSYIVTNSDLFSTQQIENARIVLQKGFDPLDDNSISANLAVFGEEFLNEVEKKTTVGGGLLKNAIYIAVIGAVLSTFLPAFIRNFK